MNATTLAAVRYAADSPADRIATISAAEIRREARTDKQVTR